MQEATKPAVTAFKNIRTFTPAPKGFNPLTAADKDLLVHGFPRRPDPVKEPGLSKIWQQAFSKPHNFIQPELVEEKIMRSAPHALAKPGFGLAGNWAGGVVQPASLGLTEPANVVYAEWVVPTISTKTAVTGAQTVGFWVGLGGWNGTQVLQAGTAATINGNSVSYWFWTEWFPAGYKVANLAVSAGDTVTVLVCAPQNDHGFVSMMNKRTGNAISVGVQDPNGTTAYDGSSVEWVIEAINTEMPNFGSVTFTNLTAGTKNHVITLAKAFTANTVSSGKTLATGKLLTTQNEVQVIWDAKS